VAVSDCVDSLLVAPRRRFAAARRWSCVPAKRGPRCAWLVAGVLASLLGGCAGHAEHTQGARSALDVGRPREALKLLNEQLEVDSEKETPPKISGDKILFVLDRSVVEQQLGMYEFSSRDLEAGDKQVEILDFSRGTLDDIAKYVFSDDSGPYAAPAYEKLLINTLNMMNYLARGDLNGARVEARRFAVMQKFIADHQKESASMTGPGSYLAGFVFEKSNQPSEALRFYDEALHVANYVSLTEPVQRLSHLDAYRSPELKKLIDAPPAQPEAGADWGEALVIVNYGRVPAKIAQRVPIGLALTIAAIYLSPEMTSRANYLAAQGLVTWVNYPTLGKPHGTYSVPEFFVGNRPLPLEGMLAVDIEAKKAWKDLEGGIVASAITRLITRIVAGETTRRVSGGGVLGALLSLGTQATMTALDTPDTRSWSTLPARIAFGRVRLPPGRQTIVLRVSGVEKRQVVDIPKNGWAVVPLTVLR
jgi:hypothetical protein